MRLYICRSCSSLVFLCIALALVVVSASSLDTLRLVHVIFRHGDRTPSKTYPTDPFQEDYWTNGWKQLTPKGVSQSFELGEGLRKLYKHFVNHEYRRNEVYVRSTDTDRTLQSAQGVMAGFYPPVGDDVWHKRIPWRPIPIHTVPKDQDPLLKVSKYECPTLDRRLKTVTMKEVYELDKKHQYLLQFLSSVTGFGKLSVMNIGHVYSPLYVKEVSLLHSRDSRIIKTGFVDVNERMCDKRQHGLQWPHWLNDTVWQEIRELKRIRRYMKFDDQIESRLSGGFLVGDVIERMRQKSKKELKNPNLKMVFYAAHDSTLLAMMGALRVSNMILPPYCAALLIELHQLSKTNVGVAIFLRNDTSLPPYPLQIRGCSELICPLDEMVRVLQETTIYDRITLDQECGIEHSYQCRENQELGLKSIANVVGSDKKLEYTFRPAPTYL